MHVKQYNNWLKTQTARENNCLITRLLNKKTHFTFFLSDSRVGLAKMPGCY